MTEERGSGARAVDDYIAAFPEDVQSRLHSLRETILGRLPGGEEMIRYDMPAVMLGGRYGLHFAGWKKHIAIYPVPVLPQPLESQVQPYRSGKDTMRFRHDRELPHELVAQICDHLVRGRTDTPPG